MSILGFSVIMASSCLHALMSRLEKDRQQVINAWPDGWMDEEQNDSWINQLLDLLLTVFTLKPHWCIKIKQGQN